MKLNRNILSAEQEDFLKEMMNIGTGLAATALTQLLGLNVDTVIPTVRVGSVDKLLPHIPVISNDPSRLVKGVKMRMLGSCTGDLLFIVPQEDQEILASMAARSNAGWLSSNAGSSSLAVEAAARISPSDDLMQSTICEMGNILAGVYLTGIYKFCGLSIVHTVPVLSTDMIQALLDESISLLSSDQRGSIMVENEFNAILVDNELNAGQIKLTAYLLIIPSAESVNVLVESIDKARAICFGE